MKNPYELAQDILRSAAEKDRSEDRAEGFTSIELYGSSVQEKQREDSTRHSFHLENESGTGDITIYQVFPGIELVYNDMHMAYCNKQQQPSFEIMEINYCKEGRCECLFGEHQYCYMAAGDLSFCSLQNQAHSSEFPTSHYHGITITVNFSQITEEMKSVLTLLSVDLDRIKDLSQMREFTILRANPAVEHIFSELYTVPEKIRHGYIRVKVLELLLVMTWLDVGKQQSDRIYFPENQIEAVKQMHEFLMAHVGEHYTIEALAEQFHLSPTVMKKCFKGVYGDSIYAYMKRYRLQVAEKLLKEGKLTVGDIAEQIGNLNPNKFTSPFRTEYGVTPTAYRKNKSLNG